MSRQDRMALFAASAWILAATAALGEEIPLDAENGRFTVHRIDEGFLRLDGRSGQVSICSLRPAGWLCRLLPDERSVLEAEIGRLQVDNGSLKKELLIRRLPLPGSIKPDPKYPQVEEQRMSLPSDAELNRMMAFIEKVWRRLVEMVVAAQRDIMKKS